MNTDEMQVIVKFRKNALSYMSCRGRGIDPAIDQDDLAQEVMLRTLQKKQSPDHPKAFVLGVARNVRSETLSRAFDPKTRQRRTSALMDAVLSPSLTGHTESDFRSRELQRRLQAALSELPQDIRKGIYLHFVEGRSWADVNQELTPNYSNNHWRVKFLRVKRSLKQKLEAYAL